MPGELDYPKETAREPPIGLKIITTSPRGPSRLAAGAARRFRAKMIDSWVLRLAGFTCRWRK